MKKPVNDFCFEILDKKGKSSFFGKGKCIAIESKDLGTISLFSYGTRVLMVTKDGKKIYSCYKPFKDQSKTTKMHINQFMRDCFEDSFKDETGLKKKLEDAPLVLVYNKIE